MTTEQLDVLWRVVFIYASILLPIGIIGLGLKPRIEMQEFTRKSKYQKNPVKTGILKYNCFYMFDLVLIQRYFFSDGSTCNQYFLKRFFKSGYFKIYKGKPRAGRVQSHA